MSNLATHAESMSNTVLLVITTCPSEIVAQQLAQALVTVKLAACVQILPGVQSVYSWQGKICQEAEIALHIKCLASHYSAIEQTLVKLHPYDVPEIIALPVTFGLPSYFDWIKDTTQP